MKTRFIEALVGLFMLGGIIAFLVLAFKVSGLTLHHDDETYKVTAGLINLTVKFLVRA